MKLKDLLVSGGLASVALCFLCALALTAYGVTEEVEVANVVGVAKFLDTEEPAAGAEVYVTAYHKGADLEGFVTMKTVANEKGEFIVRNAPVGLLTLRVYAPGYSAERTTVATKDSESIDMVLKWEGDQLTIAANQSVFTPEETASVVINGLTRRKNVEISVFAFSDKEIFEKRDTYALTRAIAYNRDWGQEPPKDQPDPAHKFAHKFRSQDIQGKFAEVVELPTLGEGIYIVRAETDGAVRHQWINVSRLGLVTKVSPDSLIGYVVDIESGKPIAGVPVSVVGPNGRKEIGKTGNDGTVRASNVAGDAGSYVMLAVDGGSKAFAMYDKWRDSDGQASAVHIQTDRPIYRPADQVQYKGFVRVPTQEGYKLPQYRTVKVKVIDPDGTEMQSEDRPVSAMGGFDGSFDALPEITGSYTIEVEIDGQSHFEYVPILAYRKPEFKITVTPVKRFYLSGENAQFKVKAEFFTGEPVVGAKLTAWAYRSQVWKWSAFDDEEYEWWAYGEDEYSYGGEPVGDFESATDENGEALFTVQTKLPQEEDDSWGAGDDYRYTLSVSGEDASGRYFTGEGKVSVARGEVNLSVAFEDYVVSPNSPVKVRVRGSMYGTGDPANGAKVKIEYGTQAWSGMKWRDQRRGEKSVTLDSKGEAEITLRPGEAGDFYAKATTTDSGRRSIVARDYVWVYESGAKIEGAKTALQVVLDKKTYKVGENATAVIRTDKPGGSALVTVEADDVLWSRVVALDAEATSVTVPVTLAVRPNASVVVCYIRDKSFARSSRGLIVDMGRDQLQVSVTPNVKETLPGGSVSYTVTTKDAEGNPIPADVSVSVVDEGVYSIREDNTDPLRSFFPNRWSAVSTYYSFPEVYLDGDDKTEVNSDVRTDFRDTAHWSPSVVTGSDGTATLTVELPDNLTSWRATATAVTANAMAGKGRSDVIARKPLMVRVSPPAFMVQDEVQTIGVSVRNETDQEQIVEMRIQTTGLTVSGNTAQRETLKPRSSGRVEWKVIAGQPGEARLRVTAAASRGGHTDGLEIGFPVRANGPTLESYNAGDTTDSSSFAMRLEQNAVSGTLEVSLSPSILGSIVESLDSLVDYPYGCVEQTMSRFMPAVVVRRLLQTSGISNASLDAKITDVSEKSQARLRTMQSSDGGFGWWNADESDPGMTALVLEGLYYAKQAGVDVNAHMLDRAINWSKNYAKSATLTQRYGNDRVRLAYALALHDVPAKDWQRLLLDPKMISDDASALAYIVLASHEAKGQVTGEAATYRDAAYKALIARADETETMMSWENDWWYEPTAVAVMAVLKTEPNSPRAGKVMRYLVTKKRGGYWTSTRDTAKIIVAAVEYLRTNKETAAPFEARVTVNGNEVGKYRFSSGNLSKAEKVVIPVGSLNKCSNEVVIESTGGQLYFSAMLTQGTHNPNPRPTNSGHGLQIKREYFRMESRRLEDGTLRQVPSKNPVTVARSGEVLHCRLTITSDRERTFVMVNDPALSNARAIDTGVTNAWEWYYWWSDQSFLDDHTAVFMRWLSNGTNIVEYSVRAEATGTSIALPATVSLMYQPDVRASTGSAKLEVRQ